MQADGYRDDPKQRMVVAYPRPRDGETWWRVAKWNRPLTSDEVAALNAEPYQFLVKEAS